MSRSVERVELDDATPTYGARGGGVSLERWQANCDAVLAELCERARRAEALIVSVRDGVAAMSERSEARHAAVVRRLELLQGAIYDLATEVAHTSSTPAVAHAKGSTSGEYADLIRTVRETVRLGLPAEAQLLVISHGDDRLLNLYGRPAWHFPRAEEGFFLGAYPADDADAIAQLERWQVAGAEFLVIPRPSFWWLDHYGGLAEYLASRCRAIVSDEVVKIFDLRADAPSLRRDCPDQGEREVVSVVLPVHNGVLPRVGRRWLHETVESALAQTGVAFEVMVVNDGSFDETGQELRHFDPWSTFNVLDLQKPRGFAAAVNLGVQASAGATVALLTLGDVWSGDKLLRQISAMHEQGLDLLGTASRIVDEEGSETGVSVPPAPHDEIAALLSREQVFLPGTLVFKRSVWFALGGFSTHPQVRFAETLDFVKRAVVAGFRVGALQDTLLTYRTYPGRVSVSPLTSPLHRAAVAGLLQHL